MIPTIGRIVHYRLSADDAAEINRRRQQARDHMADHHNNANGVQVHVGNKVEEGETYPMMITQVWGKDPTSSVNGQVFLDGNDLFWAASVAVGEGPRSWSWPTRS